MADTKITALTAISTNPVNPATFPIPMVDLLDTSMAASGTTKKVTVNQILGSGGTATLASASITGAATVGTTLGVTGVSTLASAVVTGDLTVRTNKLAVTSTGIGAGTASPLSVFTAQSQASARLSVRTTDDVFGSVTGGTALDSLNGSDASLVPFGVRGSTVTLGSSAGIGLQLDASNNVNISTGNVVMGTSGKGIDFSATPGTGTSELLYDYEEGTWTPVIKFGGTTATQNATKATYTKIGRQVTCFVETYVINLNGGTGNFEMSGLPFTSYAMRFAQGDFLFTFMSATFPAGDKMASINDSSTAFGINYFTGASGSASSLADTDFTTSSYVYAQLVYFV